MSDLNSKKIKEILRSFFSQKKDASSPPKALDSWPPNSYTEKSFNDWKFTPVFAHTSEEPVFMSFGSSLLDHYSGFATYNYLVYLIKKNETFFATMKTYMLSEGEEIPLALDEQAFHKEERDRLVKFISAPSRIFDIKNTHKRVMIFENTEMTEAEFERIIKKWRRESPTSI